jgi:phosphatidylserine/phosphatidylglycerophosphate/cardiolipin synthase-like enzyme
MNVEDVVQEMARSAPSGSELISYREVALPLFRVDVDLLVLDQKPLPPIQEHVLRAVEAGLDNAEEVAEFLGVDSLVVRPTVAELLSNDDLILTGGSGADRAHRLKLTTKGRHTAREAFQVQAVETTLQVWVDGLTRQILSISKDRQWFPAGQASKRGLVEIPASPRKAPGEVEVALELIKEKIRDETATRRSNLEVIALTGLGKVRRFAREGLALAYEVPGEELSISLVVGGELSESHSDVFARARKRSARDIKADDWKDAKQISASVPDELLAKVASSEFTERIEAERADLRGEEKRLQEAAAERTGEDQIEGMRIELARAAAKAAELEAQLENISVRQVSAWEHRGYLERALNEANERILIVSPWIRYEVVDDQFLKRLRETLDRGVEIWIGHGISKEPRHRSKTKGEADREAERRLNLLAEDYAGRCRVSRFGDTHAKVLVCDSRFSIITSFNWLSFRGDEQLEFRDERGYYVAISSHVEALFESYRPRFS